MLTKQARVRWLNLGQIVAIKPFKLENNTLKLERFVSTESIVVSEFPNVDIDFVSELTLFSYYIS